MDSQESSANAIVAKSPKRTKSLSGDDCVEIMLGAGTGKQILDMDFYLLHAVIS